MRATRHCCQVSVLGRVLAILILLFGVWVEKFMGGLFGISKLRVFTCDIVCGSEEERNSHT